MDQLTLPELLQQFDESVHEVLHAALRREGVDGMVLFQNAEITSAPAPLNRTGMVFGPGCTFKTLEEAVYTDVAKRQMRRLNTELVSTTVWPYAFSVKDGVVVPESIRVNRK